MPRSTGSHYGFWKRNDGNGRGVDSDTLQPCSSGQIRFNAGPGNGESAKRGKVRQGRRAGSRCNSGRPFLYLE